MQTILLAVFEIKIKKNPIRSSPSFLYILDRHDVVQLLAPGTLQMDCQVVL
jgi:hypothetical protein